MLRPLTQVGLRVPSVTRDCPLLARLLGSTYSSQLLGLLRLGVAPDGVLHCLKSAAGAAGYATSASAVPDQGQQPRKERSRQLSALRRYGRDLTEEARRGLLDPVIGRQDVIQRTLQVLLRRTKHNPLLIGEAGVGKTAIVEGIAQLMAAPNPLRGLDGKKLIALDVASVVAGSTYRGEFEERLQSLLQDCETAAGSVVLFIDEIHVLVGAGNVEGGLDFANMLKPALARSQLQVIGATTLDEYRQHIETDPALSRRFQPVLVEEPSPQECLQLLTGLAPRYETFHHVSISQEALATAVAAAHRYIPERRLPDSAIDLLDEAAAKVRLTAAAHPHQQQQNSRRRSSSSSSSSIGSGSDQIGSQAISGSSSDAGSSGTFSIRGSQQHSSSNPTAAVGRALHNSSGSMPAQARPEPFPQQQQGQQRVQQREEQQQLAQDHQLTAHEQPPSSFAVELADHNISVQSFVPVVAHTEHGAVDRLPSTNDQRHSTAATSQGHLGSSPTTRHVGISITGSSTVPSARAVQQQLMGSRSQPHTTPGTTSNAAAAVAAAQTWSDWITARGWHGEGEVHKQQLLEWFGASPAQPLKGVDGHRQTTEERRKKHAQLFGPAASAAVATKSVPARAAANNTEGSKALPVSASSSSITTTVTAATVQSSNMQTVLAASVQPSTNTNHQAARSSHELHLHPRSCPHCGTLVIAPLEQIRLRCHNCGFRFLNLAPEKLQLGTTVLLDKQQQHALGLVDLQQPQQHPKQQQQCPWDVNGVGFQYPYQHAANATAQVSGTATTSAASTAKRTAVAVQQGKEGSQMSAAESVAKDLADVGWQDKAAAAAATTAEPASSAATDRPQVTGQHILEVLSDATGIPVGLLTGSLPAAGTLGHHLQPAAVAVAVAAPPWLTQHTAVQELSNIHTALTTAVLGQDAAAAAIVGALRLSRLGLQHSLNSSNLSQQQQRQPGRPALSLLFRGPSGVGKSSMARVLAECLMHGEAQGVVFLSCGELSERHSISRLVGAPPGYVGYGKGGLLTEAIRRHPHCVVVLDDLERAHPDVVGLLLQAVEDGRLMDSLGHNINLRSATFIFTANTVAQAHSSRAATPGTAQGAHIATAAQSGISAERPRQHATCSSGRIPPLSASSSNVRSYTSSWGSEGADFDGDGPAAAAQQATTAAAPAGWLGARDALIAEVASRVDDVVDFQALDSAAMAAIVQQQLQQAAALAEQQGVVLQVEDDAAAWVAAAAGSMAAGARAVSQLIRRYVMVPLATAMMEVPAEADGGTGLGAGNAAKGTLHTADPDGMDMCGSQAPISCDGVDYSGLQSVVPGAWAHAVVRLTAESAVRLGTVRVGLPASKQALQLQLYRLPVAAEPSEGNT